MLFKKKDSEKCNRCGGQLNEDFSYCPYCGINLIDKANIAKEYGLLGKNDVIDEDMAGNMNSMNLGIADKLFSSVFNNLIKNIDKQIAKDMQNANIRQTPNGIKIVIGPQSKRKSAIQNNKTNTKKITEEQLQKLTSLPKKEVKSEIKRLGDKIIYTLDMPGITTPEDVFISKLESGYEVKAIGEKKVFVSTLNVELPLKSMGIEKENLLLEFSQKE